MMVKENYEGILYEMCLETHDTVLIFLPFNLTMYFIYMFLCTGL